MNKNTLLRSLPNVDKFLNEPSLEKYKSIVTKKRFIETIRQNINIYRHDILYDKYDYVHDITLFNDILNSIIEDFEDSIHKSLKKVINATGVLIHTNLGRSVLSKEVAQKVYDLTTNYTNLEYSLEDGKRLNRMHHIEHILTDITGAEAALVVNNNAASVFLVLNELARNKEVILSRSEMVEVGGSFRISSIIEESGCIVREVGTTNKTRVSDYKEKINDNTRVFLKVHSSNFKIIGFTQSVSVPELAELSKEHEDTFVFEDMGSGVLTNLEKFGIRGERTVKQAVSEGADIVCFSGDKLLGGPQAGIIVGKKKYIERLQKNQMLRCLRIDKMGVIALEATLKHYVNEKAMLRLPIFKIASTPVAKLKEQGEKLISMINNDTLTLELRPHKAMFGGGSLPEESFDSLGLFITSSKLSAKKIEQYLRGSKTPIISVIHDDNVILNLSTIDYDDYDYISTILNNL